MGSSSLSDTGVQALWCINITTRGFNDVRFFSMASLSKFQYQKVASNIKHQITEFSSLENFTPVCSIKVIRLLSLFQVRLQLENKSLQLDENLSLIAAIILTTIFLSFFSWRNVKCQMALNGNMLGLFVDDLCALFCWFYIMYDLHCVDLFKSNNCLFTLVIIL